VHLRPLLLCVHRSVQELPMAASSVQHAGSIRVKRGGVMAARGHHLLMLLAAGRPSPPSVQEAAVVWHGGRSVMRSNPSRPSSRQSFGVLFVLGIVLGACGGRTLAPPVSFDADANGSGARADRDASQVGDAFVCGDSVCDPSQICLYPACGCIALPAGPRTDAGVCPDGSVSSDPQGLCIVPFVCPPPSCVTPTPAQGSFDCSGEGAGAEANCSTINPPVPARCSRVCHEICG
jgi:hypothetical protein